ncbi:MAG TPA: transposase, partial [Bryobacteraceae bacterium]
MRNLATSDDRERSKMSKSKKRKKGLSFQDRPIEQPCAAGIDIGAREMFVAVHHDVEDRPVRRFGTFTEDLEQMADWPSRCGATTVAMESTGVYWIPLFEILDRRGLKPCVVNARHMKFLKRRTDRHECQWIQFLHSGGAWELSRDLCKRVSFVGRQACLGARSRAQIRNAAQRGIHKGAAALLWGEP